MSIPAIVRIADNGRNRWMELSYAPIKSATPRELILIALADSSNYIDQAFRRGRLPGTGSRSGTCIWQ